MSLEAMKWAVSDAPDVPASCLPVLFGLANHAGHDGTDAYPSVDHLAFYARKSERAVQRDLRELEELGLIRRGDQRAAYRYEPRYRPVVYDLAMERVREEWVPKHKRERAARLAAANDDAAYSDDDTPRGDGNVTPRRRGDGAGDPGVTVMAARGDGDGRPEVTPASPKPSQEPSLEPSLEPGGTSGGVSHVSRGEDQQPPSPEPDSLPPSPAVSGDGDPEPPRTCSTGHPPGQPCPRCGDARRAHEEWEDRQIGRRRAAEDAERRLQQEMRRLAEEQADRCRLCDGQWVTVRAVVRPRRPGQELSHRDVRLQCKHNDAENRSIADRRANMGNLDELRERYGARQEQDTKAG